MIVANYLDWKLDQKIDNLSITFINFINLVIFDETEQWSNKYFQTVAIYTTDTQLAIYS